MKLFNRKPSNRNEDPRALFRDTVDAVEERLYVNVIALRLLVETKHREILEFVSNRHDNLICAAAIGKKRAVRANVGRPWKHRWIQPC